jgi:hypothetical protein
MASKDMALHKITEFYTEWHSICPNITSKCSTIAIFKNFVKDLQITVAPVAQLPRFQWFDGTRARPVILTLYCAFIFLYVFSCPCILISLRLLQMHVPINTLTTGYLEFL